MKRLICLVLVSIVCFTSAGCSPHGSVASDAVIPNGRARTTGGCSNDTTQGAAERVQGSSRVTSDCATCLDNNNCSSGYPGADTGTTGGTGGRAGSVGNQTGGGCNGAPIGQSKKRVTQGCLTGANAKTCKVPGATAALNSYVGRDPFIQSVLQAVSDDFAGNRDPNVNTSQSIAPNALEAAAADNKTNTINWYSANVADATKAGQDPDQILAHEILHLWLEALDTNTGLRPNPTTQDPNYQQLVTVTLGDGTILTYNIGLAPGSTNTMNTAYTGYEHALIHQALVDQYGADKTGSLQSAIAQATTVQYPGQPAVPGGSANGTAFAASHGSISTNIKMPNYPKAGDHAYKGCSATSTTAHQMQLLGNIRRPQALQLVGSVYVNWDGATY